MLAPIKFLQWRPDAQCNPCLGENQKIQTAKKKQWPWIVIFMSEKALCGFMVDFRVMPRTFYYFQLLRFRERLESEIDDVD